MRGCLFVQQALCRKLLGRHLPKAIAFAWHFNAQTSCKIAPRQRLRIGFDFGRRALCHHLTAMHASTGTHVDAKVGCTDHVFVMLDHQHAVAYIAQMLEGVDQAVVVPLV